MKTKISILFLLLGMVFQSQILKSEISSTHIKYGEPIVLKIEVEGIRSDKVEFPVLKDTLSYHLELLGYKLDTLVKKEKYIFIDSISFSAYELGTFIVPSLPIIINSEKFETPGYRITVDSMIVDSLKQPLYDIRPIRTDPKIFWDYVEQYWMYMVITLAIIIITVILIILYYLEYKHKKKFGSRKDKNPDKAALRKIKKLEKSNYLKQGQSKKYYSELIFILKEYMSKRWDFPASQLLSDDLITYLEDRYLIEDSEILKTIFAAADLAKFAKSTPAIEESILHTQMAVKFIEATQIEFLNYREEHE